MEVDSDYLLEPLREGADFTLYRGRERGNQMPILAVAVAAEQPSPASLRRLEYEYSLASELDAAWAAHPLALTRHQRREVLILEDPGGEPLDRFIERHQGQPIDLTRFLRIAIGLAAALGQAHRQGLIHKDIKPANALVGDSGQVWLTGFGIASRLPRERQSPEAPEFLAGSLPYMAPEQTGRMNRSIDSRSDLYSLGVALYELSTGTLPFTAADPLEWVHCHIARRPVPPADRRPIPETLSAIIMRLLAKNAEERYQTAAGLEADLRQCLAEWHAHGRIDSFTLGTQDHSERLLVPEKLYGREREFEALLAAFNRVAARGAVELVLVSGYSGVGKSAVVNELHKSLVPPRGLFAAGKFDQYKRDIPYATLAQAFQILVRQILVKSEAELDHWRCALIDALGPNGQLIVNLIPEVEFVIGKQPPIADLPPQEARGRFQRVFRRFLGVFATAEHPLALFLDDLQWLDMATLELLERLLTDPDVHHLLLIGAYRDNEVGSSHPLTRTLASIHDAGARTQEIVLASLDSDDVGRLVSDSLRCDRNSAAPLANLVYEKTGGNPFFAIQFLMSLAEEGLLRYDRDATAWSWDPDRIRAKGYTDNVVELMVGKLRRLSDTTQTALQQLACLGNAAETAILSVVFGKSEDEIHAAHLEAARTGLIFRFDGFYAFPHDRIQEAAYALIPEANRAPAHLRIGRVLVARLSPGQFAEQQFEVANQLNRGAALLIDRDEKAQVARINLSAGKKAKASAAYASAGAYFAAGTALLDEGCWSTEYDLIFQLFLECAECEFLTGRFDEAERLLVALLQRAVSKVDQAAVYYLKVRLHIIQSQSQLAVAAALQCLCGFGIDLPAHPTEDELQREYETFWQSLNGRPIESLIRLPAMTDPELLAAMPVLSALFPAARFTDQRLWALQAIRMVRITIQHGTSVDSAWAYAHLGIVLGSVFHRNKDGYRFGKLACDLVEKHDLTASQAKVYLPFGGIAIWTQPIADSISYLRSGIRAATEAGDPTFACIGLFMLISDLFLRNDLLDVVWRESEFAMDFARQAKYGDGAAMFVSQQRFIATMQGRTASLSSFSDAQFDEAAFEAQLTADRMPLMLCSYWTLKLKARFLSCNYAEALAAADRARPLLQVVDFPIVLMDYFFYAALTMTALYESASADEQQAWQEVLKAHRQQLQEWAENNPPTFADKHALVLAEIARIEKRDADAQRLYEHAIHLAGENGFIQNEGLAQELAAQYYLARGIETAGYAYLRNARNCFDRWGAQGKAKQLGGLYPLLRAELSSATSATTSPSAGELDVETVVKASQAISSEMLLPTLIERLMQLTVEHAGAERGLLILVRDGEPRLEAEATTGLGKIEVATRQAAITPSDLPQSVLHFTIRTQEHVLLDDALSGNVFANDEYVQLTRARSVLCLPIVKQGKLVGALYLENNLTSRVFTPDRVTVLQLLASQAAISLENATLYTDLQLQVGLLQHLPVSAWTLKPDGTPDFVNQVWLEFAGQTLEFIRSRPDAWMSAVHPEDRELAARSFWEGVHSGKGFAFETRSLRAQDGTYRWHLQQAVVLRDADGGVLKFVGTTTDTDDQKHIEEALRQAQADLARINRVTTMGELTASLAHELSQPISGIMTNASVCQRRLGSDQPDLDELRTAVTRLARDAQRAAEIIGRIRSQFVKDSPNQEALGIGEIIRDTVALLRDEATRHNITVRMELAADLPQVVGDRVHLQQVAMNLIVNSIEAMKDVDGIREMVIQSERAENEQILVSVSDTGPGFPPQLAELIFDPFFTTKPHGTGMGLRISRSIIESHGGRLWAEAAAGRGATFHLILPAAAPGRRPDTPESINQSEGPTPHQ